MKTDAKLSRFDALRFSFGLGCLLLLAATGVVALPPAQAQAQELVLWRNVFNATKTFEQRTEKSVGAQNQVVNDEIFRVSGVNRLTITSPSPDFSVVMRHREIREAGKPEDAAEDGDTAVDGGTQTAANGKSLGLRLTVVLVPVPNRETYKQLRQGEAIRDGKVVEWKVYQVGESGLSTELAADIGRVTQIEVQDDARVEVLLRKEGRQLVLEAVKPEDGGSPSGGAVPYWHGKTLRFADHDILVSGYKKNIYGEIPLAKAFRLSLNYLFTDTKTALLARIMVTQQVWRSSRFALWLEGGGGAYQVEEYNITTYAYDPTWSAGLHLQFRLGDWGASATYGQLDSQTVYTVLTSWQFSKHFGAIISWQSFQGLSQQGLGMSAGF